MEKDDKIELKIDTVRLHKEERMEQNYTFGLYISSYIASFEGYPNGTASVDNIVKERHPDWKNKTDKRAEILSEELKGEVVSVRIIDIFTGKDCFEGEII